MWRLSACARLSPHHTGQPIIIIGAECGHIQHWWGDSQVFHKEHIVQQKWTAISCEWGQLSNSLSDGHTVSPECSALHSAYQDKQSEIWTTFSCTPRSHARFFSLDIPHSRTTMMSITPDANQNTPHGYVGEIFTDHFTTVDHWQYTAYACNQLAGTSTPSCKLL